MLSVCAIQTSSSTQPCVFVCLYCIGLTHRVPGSNDIDKVLKSAQTLAKFFRRKGPRQMLMEKQAALADARASGVLTAPTWPESIATAHPVLAKPATEGEVDQALKQLVDIVKQAEAEVVKRGSRCVIPQLANTTRWWSQYKSLLRLCRLRQPIQMVLDDLKEAGTRFDLPSSHPGFADDSDSDDPEAGMDAGGGAAAETGGPPFRQSKRTKQPTRKVLEALAYADKVTNATKATEESDAIPKTTKTADAQAAFGLTEDEWAVVREVGSALAVVQPALEQLQLNWCPTNHGVAYRLGIVCDDLEEVNTLTATSLSEALKVRFADELSVFSKDNSIDFSQPPPPEVFDPALFYMYFKKHFDGVAKSAICLLDQLPWSSVKLAAGPLKHPSSGSGGDRALPLRTPGAVRRKRLRTGRADDSSDSSSDELEPDDDATDEKGKTWEYVVEELKDQLDRYFLKAKTWSRSTIDWNMSDVVEFWGNEDNQRDLSLFTLLARRVLSVATSAGSERTYSILSAFHTKRRLTLSNQHMSDLLLLSELSRAARKP